MHLNACRLLIFILQWLLIGLSTPSPTNTTNLILAISPANLAADECPTPPTEFLPYSPPPGYVPGPGCPPASSGTQPSENNPPAGFYGGSGSSSGSSAQSSSGASSLRGRNLITRILSGLSPGRRAKVGLGPYGDGGLESMVMNRVVVTRIMVVHLLEKLRGMSRVK